MGERYDRVLTDVFAVQDEIARSIVAALKVTLLPGEEEAIRKAADRRHGRLPALPARPAAVPPAHRALLRACPPPVRAGRRLDPGFARAHAGIAECDAAWHLHHGGLLPVEETLATAERPWRWSRGSPRRTSRAAVALVAQGRLDEAERGLRAGDRARAGQRGPLLPTRAPASSIGRMEDAARLFRRAAELRPDDIYAPLTLIGIEHGLGRTEEALGRRAARAGAGRAGARAAARGPTPPTPRGGAGRPGRPEGAVRLAERALALAPDDHPVQFNVACVYSTPGGGRSRSICSSTRCRAPPRIGWAWMARTPTSTRCAGTRVSRRSCAGRPAPSAPFPTRDRTTPLPACYIAPMVLAAGAGSA